jgi:hypothetical protein
LSTDNLIEKEDHKEAKESKLALSLLLLLLLLMVCCLGAGSLGA